MTAELTGKGVSRNQKRHPARRHARRFQVGKRINSRGVSGVILKNVFIHPRFPCNCDFHWFIWFVLKETDGGQYQDQPDSVKCPPQWDALPVSRGHVAVPICKAYKIKISLDLCGGHQAKFSFVVHGMSMVLIIIIRTIQAAPSSAVWIKAFVVCFFMVRFRFLIPGGCRRGKCRLAFPFF